MKIARGVGWSFPFPEDGGASTDCHPEGAAGALGFRLMYEGSKSQRVYGWQSKQSSPPSLRIPQAPSKTDHVVGFRLVWEKT
ncbi:hypothetical protein EBZ80_08645 [bacterium]|nr:hypothetical protein [bacterium]